MVMGFELSKPFVPFEQLLAVLPAASKELLPKPLQGLMVNEMSPIIDYYPTDFECDLNGKQQEWEAVVLIPFIDETRLLSAMEEPLKHLTKEESESKRCLSVIDGGKIFFLTVLIQETSMGPCRSTSSPHRIWGLSRVLHIFQRYLGITPKLCK